ncbi:PAS domain-containing sensor histidine kinase [Chitinimonas koreensis]|uniref:PAS domain-containing sensor histidine kinase n=1 Tax=Chitinimonas koreensis TaxID=356302 RepID=UPI0003F6DCB1|nr:PAS domain-containing sensor histidine kinase [Chitinimonas koreensis]
MQLAGLLLIAAVLIAGLLRWPSPLPLALAALLGLALAALDLWWLHRQTVADRAAHAALRDVEARIGGIVESAMDAIITIDQSQRVVLFNAAAEAMFGCPRDSAIGAPLDWFLPDRYRAVHREHIRQFGATGVSSRRMGAARIITGLRRNGEEFPIDASISQVEEHGARFYTVILRDVTERVRTEEALRHSKEEVQAMAAAAHTMREQEQSRIARELHDELGQALTALKMDVGWLRERLPAEAAVQGKLAGMEALLDDTVKATRRLATELRPLILDDLGVVAGIEWLADNFSERTGIPCVFRVGNPALAWRDPMATAIFRIVQEALTNVARHAEASRAEIDLDQAAGEVRIRVLDDGRGFVPDAARRPGSLGLLGLRERAFLLGGEATIDSRPGGGTRVEVRLPLPPEQETT